MLLLFVAVAKAIYSLSWGVSWQVFVQSLAPECVLLSLVGIVYRMGHRVPMGSQLRYLIAILCAILALATLVYLVIYLKYQMLLTSEILVLFSWPLFRVGVWQYLQDDGPAVLFVFVLAGLFLLRSQPLPATFDKVIMSLLVGTLAIFSTIALTSDSGRPDLDRLLVSNFYLNKGDFDRFIAAEADSLSRADTSAAPGFFKRYKDFLAQDSGVHPLYREVFPALTGSNVVLVVLESVRAYDLALYGGDLELEHLDALSQNAIVLDSCYVQQPLSTKTLVSLDTGLMPLISHRFLTGKRRQLPHIESVPRVLKSQGYVSVAINNTEGIAQNNQRFQDQVGYDLTLYREDFNRGVDADDRVLMQTFEREVLQKDQRYYAMLWLMSTHYPYGYQFYTSTGSRLETVEAYFGEMLNHRSNYQRYRQSIVFADQLIGELAESIRASGSNTTLIVVGDHGQVFGEYGSFHSLHGNSLHEKSIHVPCIIYHPDIPETIREKRFFQTKDLAATVVHIGTGQQSLLNQGRSIFNSYAQEPPLFFYNDISKDIAIIDNGVKYRVAMPPFKREYLHSIETLRAEPELEDQELKVDTADVGGLRESLYQWYFAQKKKG
ncbi:MAG: sulfatase-like hydrolase/transferase [Halioglobus sp.]